VQFLGAALGALPVAALTEGLPAAPDGAGPVLVVIALTAGGTLLPFTLFAFGQSKVSAEVAGAFLNLEPLVGAIAGAVVFGDPVGVPQAVGGVGIVAGIGLSSLPLITRPRSVSRRTEAPLGPSLDTPRRAADCHSGGGRAAVARGEPRDARVPRRPAGTRPAAGHRPGTRPGVRGRGRVNGVRSSYGGG
jgi:hypothetical protein